MALKTFNTSKFAISYYEIKSLGKMDLSKHRYRMASKDLPKTGNIGFVPVPGTHKWAFRDNWNWIAFYVAVSHVTEDAGHNALIGLYQEKAQAHIEQTEKEREADWADADALKQAMIDNRQVQTNMIEVIIDQQGMRCFIATAAPQDLEGDNGIISQLYKAGVELNHPVPWANLSPPLTFYDDELTPLQNVIGAYFLQEAIASQYLKLGEGRVSLVRWDGEGLAKETLSKSVGNSYDQAMRQGAMVLSAGVTHGAHRYTMKALDWRLSAVKVDLDENITSPDEVALARLGILSEIFSNLNEWFDEFEDAGRLHTRDDGLPEEVLKGFRLMRKTFGDVVEPEDFEMFLADLGMTGSTANVYQNWLKGEQEREALAAKDNQQAEIEANES